MQKLTVFLGVLIFTCSWIELDVAHVSNCFLFVKTYMKRIHAVRPILIQSTFQSSMMIKKNVVLNMKHLGRMIMDVCFYIPCLHAN